MWLMEINKQIFIGLVVSLHAFLLLTQQIAIDVSDLSQG